MEHVHLTLIGKPGCHLCDDARNVITSVMAELAANPEAPSLELDEKSIVDDAMLREQYVEEIPVVLINGRMHTYWRVDPGRLTTALLEEK